MAKADQEHLFVARLQKIWIMRCVDVPRDVSQALRDAAGKALSHPPVHGFIEGLPFRSTLVPGGGGAFRLHVHSRIWRKLKIDAGAEVEITMMLDQGPRPAVVPADLAAALAAVPRAQKMFNSLTLALRRQILLYVAGAKHASTRAKRVQLIVQRMLERAARAKKPAARTKPSASQANIRKNAAASRKRRATK